MKCFIMLVLAVLIMPNIFADIETSLKKYDVYIKDQTQENLVELIDYMANDDEKSHYSSVILGSVYLHELEKQINLLEANRDSLSYQELFGYANLLLDAKRFQESIEIYNILNNAAPAWSCPWRHKGEALLKMGNLEEAEEATKKAIESREDHFDAYIQLAKIQKAMGKYEVALQNLEQGLKYQENDHEGEVQESDIIELRQSLQECLE